MNGYKEITDPRNPQVRRTNGYMLGSVNLSANPTGNPDTTLKVFTLLESIVDVEPIGYIVDEKTHEQYEEYSISEIFDFFSHTSMSLAELRNIKICKRMGARSENGLVHEHPWVLFVPMSGADLESLTSVCIPHNELINKIHANLSQLKELYKRGDVHILKDNVHYSTDDNRFIVAVVIDGEPYCDYNDVYGVCEIKVPIRKLICKFDVDTRVSFSIVDGMFTGDASLFFTTHCVPYNECVETSEGLRIHKLFSDLIEENERTIKFIQMADECLLPPDKGESEIKKCETIISLKERINNRELTVSMMDYIKSNI